MCVLAYYGIHDINSVTLPHRRQAKSRHETRRHHQVRGMSFKMKMKKLLLWEAICGGLRQFPCATSPSSPHPMGACVARRLTCPSMFRDENSSIPLSHMKTKITLDSVYQQSNAPTCFNFKGPHCGATIDGVNSRHHPRVSLVQ